jgi:hypothetical protein
MTHSSRTISRQLAEILFEDLDNEKLGSLNLENMKKLYQELPIDFKDIIREKLRKFIIENQKFLISKDEFIELFPKNTTPCIHIDLSNVKEVQRIKELSQSELQSVLHKRLEALPHSDYKAKFIKKGRPSSKPGGKREERPRSKDLVFIRKSYFSSLS